MSVAELRPTEAIPDPIDVQVGERIRGRRQAAKMSQQVLAEGIGVSFQQVQKYERGTNRISASMLCHAAKTLGCEPWDLLPSVGKFNRPEPIQEAYRLLGRADGPVVVRALARMPRWAFNVVHDLAVALDARTRARDIPDD